MSYKDIVFAWISRHRGMLWIAAILLFIVYVFGTHTIMILDVSKPTGITSASIEGSDKNGARQSVLLIGSVAIVDRSISRVSMTSGDLFASINVGPLPVVGIKEARLSLERDRNADKVASSGYGCGSYDAGTDNYSAFSCTKPKGFYVYKTSKDDDVAWKNELTADFPQAYNASAYANGVLGIADSPTPWLFYANTKGDKNLQLQLPNANMSKDELGSISVIPDTADSSKKHFLLVDNSTGVIYFGEQVDESESVSYKNYSFQKSGFNPRFSSSSCKLVNTMAYCYFGQSSASPDSEGEEENRSKSTDNTFAIIDFSKQSPSASSYIIRKEEPVDQLSVDEQGNVYTLADAILYRLVPSGKYAERTAIATNVSAMKAGKKLYYTYADKLYEYDASTQTTHMRFSSNKLRISSINLFADTVFFGAYADGSPQGTLYTYKLLKDEDTSPGNRLIDKLPIYPSVNQIDIVDMDYYQDTIHVVLPGFTSLDANGQFAPDNVSYNNKKQEVANYLSNVVPSFNGYKLTFSRADTT